MTLDNNAKIGDIITALEGMQGINQKAELASVIGSPATATDNIATQITKIQDAKNVIATKTKQENTLPLLELANGINIGLNYRTGNSTSTPIIVNGLPFKPVIVIVKQIDSDLDRSLCVYVDKDFLAVSNGINLQIRNTSSLYNGTTTIFEDGFSMTTNTTNANWIAIGI